MSPVAVYFDLVSPYSYLALARLPELESELGLDWEPVPVVYAALLDATGLIGPVETEAKRRYTFLDIRRSAALAGVPLVGPPEHPFRSIESLRAILAVDGTVARRALAVSLADACWARGRDLTDLAVLADEVERCGLDGDATVSRLDTPAIKRALHENTDRALAAGVFGVPTFALGEELFWGQDRIPHLIARMEGGIADPTSGAERLLDRPRGADRRGRPDG